MSTFEPILSGFPGLDSVLDYIPLRGQRGLAGVQH